MQADEVDKIMAMRKNKVKMSNMQSEKPKDSKPMEIVEVVEGGENDTTFQGKLLRLTKTDDSKRGAKVDHLAMLQEILMKRLIIFGEVRADKNVIEIEQNI